MYERLAVIGDSWSSGYYKAGDTLHKDIRKYSWIANLARKNGCFWWNFAKEGSTVAAWLGKQEGWRNDSATGINAMMAAPASDLYVILWGSNERSKGETYPIGSMADINDADYTQNADTFYGNTARCVQAIMAHAPLAKIIFICADPNTSYTGSTVADGDLNQPRIDIINHFGIARMKMDDDYWYYDHISKNRTSLPYSHPSFTDMSGMALAFERLLSKCVNEYRTYFEDYYNADDFKLGDDTNPNTNEEVQ